MLKRYTGTIISLVSVLILGCYTTNPIITVDPNIPISKYELFEVEPVIDDTGKDFDFDVAGELTEQIILKLQGKGYSVIIDSKNKKNILLIRSTLISYEPGNAVKRWLASPLIPAGKTQATVRSILIDKNSGKIIGDIVFAEAVQEGGLYSIGAHIHILAAIAKGLTDEIQEKMNKARIP